MSVLHRRWNDRSFYKDTLVFACFIAKMGVQADYKCNNAIRISCGNTLEDKYIT